MTLEEYYELEVLLDEHDWLIQKLKRKCEYCLFFEKTKEEDMITCEGWCKLMPTSVKKSPFDHCGQFEEK
jgi:hypothetical protein